MPDVDEMANGFNPIDVCDGSADQDLDGAVNVAELTAHTDPADPFDVPASALFQDGTVVSNTFGCPGVFPSARRSAGGSGSTGVFELILLILACLVIWRAPAVIAGSKAGVP